MDLVDLIEIIDAYNYLPQATKKAVISIIEDNDNIETFRHPTLRGVSEFLLDVEEIAPADSELGRDTTRLRKDVEQVAREKAGL